MDLGIAGRKAIVCASSRGLGKACALALAQAGCDVVVNGRDAAVLAAAAKEISGFAKGRITPVACDVGTPEGRAALLKACPEPDILINNNGGPPPKAFRSIGASDILAGVEANMITPIALIQSVLDGMIARKFGRIINITSATVRAPITGLDVSSGARAGLTAFLAAMAREAAKDGVTINSLQPGMFDTDRLRGTSARMAELQKTTPAEMARARMASVPARRFGTPEEFGNICAFLASRHTGYITGQNLLIDGGLFPGAF